VGHKHPNSLANLRRFKAGAEWEGNKAGARRCGATIREWWNNLTKEDANGKPKYSMEQIAAITNAPADDTEVSPAKRIAARHIVEMAKGGRTGAEISRMVFDRTEGKAPQHVSVSGGPEVKRIVLIDQALPELVQEALPAAENNGA